MMRALTILVASAAIAVAAHAQARPDFSGRWTSEPEAAPAPAGGRAGAPGGGARGGGGAGRGRSGDMGSGWGTTITVTQDQARLNVEYAFFGRGDMQPPLRFAYALNGSETTNSVMMGRGVQPQRSRAAWRGDTLAITTVHTFPHPETGQATPAEVVQSLVLESPTSLVVITTRAGVLGGPPSTTRTVYRRLPTGD